MLKGGSNAGKNNDKNLRKCQIKLIKLAKVNAKITAKEDQML